MSKGLQLLGGLALLFLYFLVSVGCDLNNLRFRTGSKIPGVTPATTGQTAGSSIVMGSFNIQVFGRAKIGNSDVTNVLVDVVRRFDILAIQELRSTDQSIIPRFVEMVNADGSQFKYIIGPRQGYTISTEQYVYIYDSEKIEVISEPFVAPVPAGEIHRSPLVARFRCLNVAPEQAFTFALLNVHVDPDEVPIEHPTLVRIIDGVRQYVAEEDDLILVGDLNAPPRYFQAMSFFANQYPAIADEWATKTAQDLNRDNIVFDGVNTQEFLGQSGVLNLMREYNLSVEDALSVSDHLPVWAVFSTTEASRASVGQDAASVWR